MLSSNNLLQQQQPRHSRQNSLASISGSPRRQSTTLSPTFGRLSTQDFPPTNPQHSPLQRTQPHSSAQPGHTLDNRVHTQLAHLQMIQMMQEQASISGMAPPESAVQSIQNQIKSFYQVHPEYMAMGMSPQSRPGSSPMPGPSPMVMPIGTPLMMPRAVTPPLGFLPTPPHTVKQPMGRMRHMDVSPMALNLSQVPMVQFQPPTMQDMPLFQDAMGNEYAYSSPSYAGSIASQMSPHMSPPKQSFCEDSPMMPHPMMMDAHTQAMMAAAAAGGSFYYPDSPTHQPLSPREQMLASLPVDASIEDTGISAEEVSSYISPQDPEGKWTCMFPECGKKFGRKENIRSHVQTHLGDRQFKCNHCGKCFVRKHDLKRHAKIHSGDKPHKCPCGNGFARQDALTRHRQRGVCSGTLPGFERREVKRGRPRKTRPELSDRADKAARARRRDAGYGTDDSDEYSSGCSPSDSGSEPFTPPAHAGSDDEQNLDTAAGVEAFIRAYEHTPPVSPHSQASAHEAEQFDFTKESPSPGSQTGFMALPEASLGDSIFDWGGLSAQPSLVADGGSSPAPTDLFGDELELTGEENDSMFGKSQQGFDFQGGMDEWISLSGGR